MNKNKEHQTNKCQYCTGIKPLTDKIYEDGTKFDDLRSTKIKYIGKVPVLTSGVKPKYFDIFKGLKLIGEQKEIMSTSWFVEINYCPICGRKLWESENNEI